MCSLIPYCVLKYDIVCVLPLYMDKFQPKQEMILMELLYTSSNYKIFHKTIKWLPYFM